MKSFINVIVVLICMLVVFHFNTNAQSLNDLENLYEELRRNLSIEKIEQDSLYKNLEDRTKLIEEEKNKLKPDHDKIVKLMAGSVTVSRLIEVKQTSINKLEFDLESVRKKLFLLYSYQIDSLNNLKRKKLKPISENEIDIQILNLIKKRLLITPPVKQLTFVPEKIVEIDLKKVSDSLQMKIYKEYLTNALAEVDSLLYQVIKTSNEVEQLVKLHKKTNKFIDDIDFISQINPIGTKTKTLETSERDYVLVNDPHTDFKLSFQSYVTIINQLSFSRQANNRMSRDKQIDLNGERLSLKEYSEFLKELKLRLNDYRIILVEKLKNH